MLTKKLVKKAQRGNKKALSKLIQQRKHDYYRLAYSFVRNKTDAMDAIADMTTILYEKVNTLKKHDAFYSWSNTILINCCRAILRKRKKVILIDEWDEEDKNHPNMQLQMEVKELLMTLSPEHREAIILRHFHDYNYKYIAEITGVSEGTIKSRVHYAIEKMRREMRRIENE